MRIFILCFVIGVAIGITGCGKSGYPSATLEGKVTVNQQPLAEGSLQFLPQEKGQGPVVGGAIREGRYLVKDVPLGKVRVLFNSIRKTHRLPNDELGREQWATENLIPQPVRAGMVIEVTDGQTAQDFEL